MTTSTEEEAELTLRLRLSEAILDESLAEDGYCDGQANSQHDTGHGEGNTACIASLALCHNGLFAGVDTNLNMYITGGSLRATILLGASGKRDLGHLPAKMKQKSPKSSRKSCT